MEIGPKKSTKLVLMIAKLRFFKVIFRHFNSAISKMTSPEVISQQILELRLTGIRKTYTIRAKQCRDGDLSYDDFLSLLLQGEIDHRKNAKINRLLKRAPFKQTASLEHIDLKSDRGLEKRQLRELGVDHISIQEKQIQKNAL